MIKGTMADTRVQTATLHNLHLSERSFHAWYLGIIKYDIALEFQKIAVQKVNDGRVDGIILLMQHPPVITIGRFRGDKEIRIPSEILKQEGIEIFNTNRGGSVTCHELGQLVVYPIFSLKNNALGVRDYVWNLEEVIIRALSVFGIDSNRLQGYPGVWVGDKKICSIGIHIQLGITMHGFALNVNNDLRCFDYINPCGIQDVVMTSMSQLQNHQIDLAELMKEILNTCSAVFGWRYQKGVFDAAVYETP